MTRCNQDSKLVQLWRMAAPPCQVGDMEALDCGGRADIVVTSNKKPRLEASRSRRGGDDGGRDHHAVRPATSRGTQRLYVRLNTLHYLLAMLHGIDRTLSSAQVLAPHRQRRRRARSSSAFDHARPAIDAAVHHVSELAAYRLVFLDSAQFLHQALYQGGVAAARARPALRVMKQNLAFLSGVLTEQAQPPAVLEVMRASVEAFLTVVLAGGSGRAFARADHAAVAEDFASLKRVFCGYGGVAEEVVERETARAEGVLALMAVPTEKLIHEFLGHYGSSSTPMAPVAAAADELLPRMPMMMMPVTPTARRWSRSDADTVLRVLCYRDDEAANRFLKKAFDLPKRR